jgi:hypothetical protein
LEFLETTSGEEFYHRVPVEITHGYKIQLFDEMGTLISNTEWTGRVVSDDESWGFGNNTRPLEAIVDVLPAPKSTGSSALDAHLKEEVKVEKMG